MSANMTFEDWVKKYKPVKNHITKHSHLDGIGFESYGVELDFVNKHDKKYIWTVMHGDGCNCGYDENGEHATGCDGDIWLIYNGIGIVNRVCYLVTEKPENKEKMSVTVEY